MTRAATQIPPAPSHKIPMDLPSSKLCPLIDKLITSTPRKSYSPAIGATIPATRPKQDSIPLADPR